MTTNTPNPVEHMLAIVTIARAIADNQPVDLHRLANQIERLTTAVDNYDAALRAADDCEHHNHRTGPGPALPSEPTRLKSRAGA